MRWDQIAAVSRGEVNIWDLGAQHILLLSWCLPSLVVILYVFVVRFCVGCTKTLPLHG